MRFEVGGYLGKAPAKENQMENNFALVSPLVPCIQNKLTLNGFFCC